MSSGNEILDTYIYENNSLLEQLEAIVLDAEQLDTFSQDNINEIFRIMHTIKGSSAMMEFDTLTTVAHRIEDLFFIIRENSMTVVPEQTKPDLFNMMFQAIDYFRTEMEKVETEQPLDKDIDSFLQNINSLIAKIKGEEAPEAPAPAENAAAPAAEEAPAEAAGQPMGRADFPYSLLVFYDEGCGMENLRAFMLVTSVRDFCGESDLLYEPQNIENDVSTAQYVVDNGFLMMFKNKEDRDKAITVVRSSGSVKSYEPHDYEPPAPAPSAAEPAPAETNSVRQPEAVHAAPSAPAAPSGTPTSAAQPQQKESLISVHQSKLDQLSALVGEIVITEAMVIGSPDLKGLQNLDAFAKSARELRKLTDELQDVSMSLRMVPVATSFQKMHRIVRDMSKKLGKHAKLTIIGEDTEVDKTIVDNIGDPIMHMVRNSMDHGLEDTEEERIAAGKPPVGEIILSAQDTGSEVLITIQDDGKGVNYEKVLQKAINNGLASPDTDYSNKEILNFLLMPGFSTNEEATEFSGRGVGMDVVKRGVEDLGGSVSLSSTPGKGMTTTLRIPLTMSIMDGMEVSVGNSIFTIPIQNIRQNLKVSAKDILHDSVNGEIIKVMDSFYPIIRAKSLYSLSSGVDNIEEGVLMWLEAGDVSYCLLVDELLGEHQVVVKPLPAYVNNFDIKEMGIMGCSILGDGSISVILDVGNIASAALGRYR